jgi:hypothetical protein
MKTFREYLSEKVYRVTVLASEEELDKIHKKMNEVGIDTDFKNNTIIIKTTTDDMSSDEMVEWVKEISPKAKIVKVK